jgi:Putative peptidoglycan binding domain
LLRTLTGLDGIARVQILVDGIPPRSLVLGISLARPVTLRLLQTPNPPHPVPPQFKLPPPDPATKDLQRRLIALGYLLRGDDDGRLGPATQDALLAFQSGSVSTSPGVSTRRRRSNSRPHPAHAGFNRSARQAGGDPPTYPASHGCVRQRYTVARWTYRFAYVGMPVTVIAKTSPRGVRMEVRPCPFVG